MLFVTQKFLLFFLVVFAAYWLSPGSGRGVWLLLVASYYFYFCFNQWLALVVASSSVADYLIARGIDRTARSPLRPALLASASSMNLGLLCYFKYANFFLDSLYSVRAAARPGPGRCSTSSLPVGISFYTFEAISYAVDVYRGKIQAERSLRDFLLFILFFPHLVAGPIVRAGDFLPQIAPAEALDLGPAAGRGATRSCSGCSRRWSIADRMAAVRRPGLRRPGRRTERAVPGWPCVAYALQIYCDFSGYSDMALGTAHLLGYQLTNNFNMPYLAPNVTEFWRRWHISLSTWLRDYLYIPLGGSRGGRVADLPQPDDHDDARRAVARGELELRALGRAARVVSARRAVAASRARVRDRCLALRTRRWHAFESALTFVPGVHRVVFFRAPTFCDRVGNDCASMFVPGPGQLGPCGRSLSGACSRSSWWRTT